MKSEGFLPPALSADKRRHTRFLHNDTVQCIAGSGVLYGHCVNLSRGGMQLVVHQGVSHDSIRSIAFTLPNSPQTLHMPCRLVRAEGTEGKSREKVLGIEFSPNADAQLLLIDTYIREAYGGQAPPRRDLRELPRADCLIDAVQIDRAGVRVVSIENISAEGLLMHFTGPLAAEEEVTLSFRLPGDDRLLRVSGRVIYVIQRAYGEVSSAGIELRFLRELDRSRVGNYAVSVAARGSLQDLHHLISRGGLHSRYRIEEAGRIRRVLEALCSRGGVLNVLLDRSARLLELAVERLDPKEGRLLLWGDVDLPTLESQEAPTAYCSFYVPRCSYYFSTALLHCGGQRAALAIPTVIYQSEKRSYQRKRMELEGQVELDLQGSHPTGPVLGRLLDVSWRGFRCEIPLDPHGKEGITEGQHLRYAAPQDLDLQQHGVVRHVSAAVDRGGNPVLRIGVEAGVRRREVPFSRYTPEQWARAAAGPRKGGYRGTGAGSSTVVRYHNRKGQEIVGLLNSTSPGAEAPVVIIPPAFGKKKEVMSALAATLLATFERYGKKLVTLRFDGIDRPGESFNHQRRPRRGYEMLHYRLFQGLEDLRTTLEWVHDNPYFTPTKVFLVTSSLAAMDARKLLASPDGQRVDAWVSCMGVPCARSAYGNLLGGLDIIGNHRMGIPNGVAGVLGYLLDLDRLAAELIAYRYAYITDARFDMARIAQPVLWIYGSHDRWLVADEIHDIMSVDASGPREVVEIPTGHNLSSSRDAVRSFQIIAAHVYRQAHGRSIEPVEPDREQLLRLVTYERERLRQPREFSPEQYWQGYLVGNEQGSQGYDFYANFREFREFLARECELLEVRPGDRIADLGCGTGLLLETLLTGLSRREGGCGDLHILAADLVEEALHKAQEKCKRLVDGHASLEGVRLEFRRMDLSPNRLLPVQQFLDDPALSYDFLRNRVSGLRNVTIDALHGLDCSLLRRVVRGAPLDQDTLRELSDVLHDGHRASVLDFNRAARFLKRHLDAADLRPDKQEGRRGPLPLEAYSCLTAGDLRFEALDFAHSGLEMRLPLGSACFSKVVASLLLSYLFNPDLLFPELFRILEPGGLLVVSALRPDSDLSGLYMRFIEGLQNVRPRENVPAAAREAKMRAARAMLNEAAGLMSLGEEGLFTFHSAEELEGMFRAAGFQAVELHPALGSPPQVLIVTGRKP